MEPGRSIKQVFELPGGIKKAAPFEEQLVRFFKLS